ncbi:DUF1918 domain-containing protein [Mycobacterium sp. ITM-2017-0098]|nr:DUF1918 domain-containing protein [Mycobacterium sp. ITM-2017-0098]
MKANVGDWLVLKATRVDQPEKRGQITDIRSDDGSPPYVVRWLDSDHEATVFPGTDAVVVTAEEQHEAEARAGQRIDAVQSAIRHRYHR